MKLTLPFPPSINKMYKVARKRLILSDEGRLYKRTVAAICKKLKVRPMKGHLKIYVDAYRPRKRGDLDNLFKCLFDSMNRLCYADDSQIVEIHARRFDDKARPRVEVEIKNV